jgi:hypothetical protein
MTYEDAVKLCAIIEWADGGCSHCVTGLMNSLVIEWPAIDWRAAFKAGATHGGGDWEQSDKV